MGIGIWLAHPRTSGRARSSRRRAGSRRSRSAWRWPASRSPGSSTSVRAISADRLFERFGPDRRGRGGALLARRSVRRSSTAGVILGVSRLIGWVDRYLVDGILNVLSAWTLTRGRPAAPHPDRPGPGLRLRRRARACCSSWSGCAGRSSPMSACAKRPDRTRDVIYRNGLRMSSFPVLSIITWAPFVGAILIMFLARRHGRCWCAGWPWLSTSVSLVLSICGLRGLRPRGGGLPVLRGLPAGARARHQLSARRRRHERC